MTHDLLTLLATAFLAAVLVGYGYPLGRWLWRRTLLVDHRWAERRAAREVVEDASRARTPDA